MSYNLTDDQKGWFAALAVLISQKMSERATINDSDLDTIEQSFSNTQQASQVTAWKAWVKGGARPNNPH